MNLTLSTETPWNADYCNEAGQVLYRAASQGVGLVGCSITVSSFVPIVKNREIRTSRYYEADTRYPFERVAEMDCCLYENSHIKYRGVDYIAKNFFGKAGVSFYGRNPIFKGPDEREYVWKLTMRVCKLFLHDSSNTPVAIFHPKRHGIFRESRPAFLEILPAGEHMIDLIVVTLIYVEKLRQRRIKSSESFSHSP